MIGGSLYGTGKRFAALTPENRVTAMEVPLLTLNVPNISAGL